MYVTPRRDRFRRNDELAVLISLLVSVGMLAGTAIIVWMRQRQISASLIALLEEESQIST
jgi:hypothetical protein